MIPCFLWWNSLRYVPDSCLMGSRATAGCEPQHGWNLQIYCSIIHSLLLLQVMVFSIRPAPISVIFVKTSVVGEEAANYNSGFLLSWFWWAKHLFFTCSHGNEEIDNCKKKKWVKTRNCCSAATLIICSSASGCQDLDVSRIPTLTILPVVKVGSQPASVCRGTYVPDGSRDRCLQWEKFLPPGNLQTLKGILCSVSECKFDELMRFIYAWWFDKVTFWPFWHRKSRHFTLVGFERTTSATVHYFSSASKLMAAPCSASLSRSERGVFPADIQQRGCR